MAKVFKYLEKEDPIHYKKDGLTWTNQEATAAFKCGCKVDVKFGSLLDNKEDLSEWDYSISYTVEIKKMVFLKKCANHFGISDKRRSLTPYLFGAEKLEIEDFFIAWMNNLPKDKPKVSKKDKENDALVRHLNRI